MAITLKVYYNKPSETSNLSSREELEVSIGTGFIEKLNYEFDIGVLGHTKRI